MTTGTDLDAPIASGTAPIPRSSLHEQVANRVRDMIIEGRLASGERINEAALIRELGVSRTPFREALRTLAAENLVEIRPSLGAVVRKLTPEEVFAMLQVLGELEKLAGRLCCERASETELRHLLALHETMMEHYRNRDRLPYYKANQAIHSTIARLSGNPILQEVQAGLQSRLKRIRYIGNRSAERWAGAVAEHEEMARALQARDGNRLGEVLARHLANTWDRVRDVV